MSRPIYLDHAATTPVDPAVAAAMAQCLTQDGDFGNPASADHEYGTAASRRVEAARAQVAAAAGARPDEVIFTSGATEANNLAIFGTALYHRGPGRHVVTSRIEHKAVLDPCRELGRRGWTVSHVAPDAGGVIDCDAVAAALREDTVLVSIMSVNNETGARQDVAAIAAECRRRGVTFHVDAAQSLGKQALEFGRWGVDLLSLSAHKAYGPKGAGALLAARRPDGAGANLQALMLGGGQERGLRAGTVATHQVVGMGLACETATARLAEEVLRLAPLRERLWAGLRALGGVLRNGDPARSVPQILSVSFEGVEGESLMAALRPHLAVSSGSACMSATSEPSYVLRALGRDDVLAESSLRFSLGRSTTALEIDGAIAAVGTAVRRLRELAGWDRA